MLFYIPLLHLDPLQTAALREEWQHPWAEPRKRGLFWPEPLGVAGLHMVNTNVSVLCERRWESHGDASSCHCPAAHSPALDLFVEVPRPGFTSKKTDVLGNPPIIFGDCQAQGGGLQSIPYRAPWGLNADICKCFELQSAAVDLPGPDLLWSSDLAVWAPASQGDPRLSWGAASGKPRVTGVQVSVEGVEEPPSIPGFPQLCQEGFDHLCILNPVFIAQPISENDLLALCSS